MLMTENIKLNVECYPKLKIGKVIGTSTKIVRMHVYMSEYTVTL